MENRISPISYNTFDAIFLTSEFCCVLSSIVMYANVPTVSAHKNYEQLPATSQGQFCLVSYSDVKKTKGNDLLVRL